MKTRTRKRHKTNKAMLIGGAILGLFIVAAAAALISAPKGKKPAQEYFQVVWSDFGDPNFPDAPDNYTNLIMYGVSFNITAVGGDAHEVIIQGLAMAEPEELGDITKGQIVNVYMTFESGYFTQYNQTAHGFPVTIRIRSVEAEGELKFYIPFEIPAS